jgi:ADP-heptose:LPS heptosyltransferase
VTSFRQSILSALPAPLRLGVKSLRKKFQDRVDIFSFPIWLLFQCGRHRKKAVIVFRLGALGDVVCTLPLCGEIRKRHPGKLLIFVTAAGYRKMVLLSDAVDCVYGSFWKYGIWKLPALHRFGLVEKIYCPQTTDERLPNTGSQSHLVDDLAASCGLTIPNSNRQPRLLPSAGLIKIVQVKYGLTEDITVKRIIIGINCGRTWPVRMWDADRWQKLVDRIHAECDAVILQFGVTRADGTDEYDNLTGVQSVVNRVKSDELVALIASCHLLVSIDSGPVHLAGAVGTPVIGLFGAVNPQYRLPPESPAVGLFSNVPCLFCHHATPRGHWQSGCPNNISCMEKLDVQTVFHAVKSMLAKLESDRFRR